MSSDLQNTMQSCKRADQFRPEPENISRDPKTNLKPKSCPKTPEVKLDLKNLAMLPSYFDYTFLHLRQKAHLRPELSPRFLSTLGPNAVRTRPEKPGRTYNSDTMIQRKSTTNCHRWAQVR